MEHISEPSLIADRSDMSSGWEQGLRSPLTFWLLSCGGIGVFLFTVTYLIEGVTWPGYDGWRQPISALSLGPGGWVQQVNFVVFGVLTLLSVVGWYRLLRTGRAKIGFPLYQSIAGLGLIVAGFFSMDCPVPGFRVLDNVLRPHRARQLEKRLAAGSAWVDRDLVFPDHDGDYLIAVTLLRRFRKLLREAGLPRIRFHDLRHSAATLLGLGVEMKIVQELLGHSSITITADIYGHVLPPTYKGAMDKMDGFLDSSSGHQ